MADTRIAMMGQPVNVMLPSEALANAYNLKKSQMQSDAMAGEMRDNALMDKAYRAAGGDVSKMDKSGLGFSGGMKIAGMEADMATAAAQADKAKAQADKERIRAGMDKLELGGQIFSGATPENWQDVRTQFHELTGIDVGEQYDPAKVQQLQMQGIKQKDLLANEWKQKGYNLDVARFGEQQRHNNAVEGISYMNAQNRGEGGSDKAPKIVTINGQSFEQLPDGSYRQPMVNGQAVPTKSASKPMPASASKLETDLLEDLSVAKGIQTLTKNYIDKIDKGELTLGAATNAMGAFSTKYGELPLVPKADKGDVIREGFLSDMKKLRNDSLRLNKGVQTDGDAQREWETLFNNINNADVVKNTLLRINDLDARAEQLKRVQIDTQRQNFSADPFDYSKIDGIGGSNEPQKPSYWGRMSPEHQKAWLEDQN